MNKYIKLGIGLILQALGIALVISSGTTFAITSFNQGISKTFFVSYGTASLIVEVLTILINYRFKEKIGITTIASAILNGYLVDVFLLLVPTISLSLIYLPFGTVIMAIGFYFLTIAGLGNSSSNGLTTAIQKIVKKDVGIVRISMDASFMLLGYILGGTVNVLTIVLTFTFGYVLQLVYKLFKFDPTKVNHQYLGGNKMKLPPMEVSNFIKHKVKVYEMTIESLKTNIELLKKESTKQ